MIFSACSSGPPSAAPSFYSGDLVSTREQIRPLAYKEPLDENSLLNNARLGMAALADGDLSEAKRALRTAYQIQESGNVNDDTRVFAATVLWEGVKVWKGEPFEQALTAIALADTYALEGDWQNVRVASRATLRRLKDYSDAAGKPQQQRLTQEDLARRAAESEAAHEDSDDGYDYFVNEGRFVDTDFTLGYLMQGLADRLIGETSDALAFAVRTNPRVAPLADAIAAGAFNTVLIVDYARGPRKVRSEPDGVVTDWLPISDGSPPPLSITIDGAPFPGFAGPVCNVNTMARDHRWNNFENARRAKSTIGTALMIGGGVVAASSNDQGAQLAGLGALLAGLALKASAAADIRYNELLPSAVYLSVLEVPPGAELRIGIPGDASSHGVGATFILPRFRTLSAAQPRVVYLRVTPGSPGNAALSAPTLLYTNDAEPPAVGDFPYILGGHCVATPTTEVLRTYQAGGYLTNLGLTDLESLYAEEGILLGVGSPSAGRRLHADNRHILEGGNALYTPAYATDGYKRIMYLPHQPWTPRSPRARELTEQIRSANP